MRIASCNMDGRQVYGRVINNSLAIPEQNFLVRYPDLIAVIAAGAFQELEKSPHELVPLQQLSFLPPIPRPGKIFAVGINYMVHIREMGREPPEYPVVFTRSVDSLVGHEQTLLKPRVSDDYDFEGELAVVIGKTARYVSAADALNYIAGYTCLNDGSVRDFQRHGSQFTPGKNFPESGACGPWLVTSDEIPDPSALQLETRLNGTVMQSAPVSDMRFSVPDIISYCSTFARLQPGDVITTGTPGGVGAARKPPVWLRPGDRIEVEISEIGVLSNQVAAE